MASLNKVFLLGNLTRDPDMRYTTGGTAICKFGLAVNRRYTTGRGEEREEVCFVDIDVFGKQAESCGNFLRRGAPALVEGRLQYDQWDDRETGKKRSRLLVNAERVQFLGSPGGRVDVSGMDSDDYESGGYSQQANAPSYPSRQVEEEPMPPFTAPDINEDVPDDIPF